MLYIKKLLIGVFVFEIALSTSLGGHEVMISHVRDTESPISIFSHGLGAHYNCARPYLWDYFCTDNCVTFNYPDAPEKKFWRNYHTGLAQNSEIKKLESVVKAVENEYKQPMVLYGVSRGASTIINFVGNLAKNNALEGSIKALVLESPFAHCRDAIECAARRLNIHSAILSLIARFLYKEYSEETNAPIDLVEHMPADLPILLIFSAEDVIVPAQSTRRLYEKLRQRGHKNVYLLELAHGEHGKIIRGSCAREYQAVLHAFYRSIGLPFSSHLAEAGQERFEKCQPEGAVQA